MPNMDVKRDFFNSKEYFTCCVNSAILLMYLTLSDKLSSTLMSQPGLCLKIKFLWREFELGNMKHS